MHEEEVVAGYAHHLLHPRQLPAEHLGNRLEPLRDVFDEHGHDG